MTGIDAPQGDAADRRLHLLVGTVLVAAGAATCVALTRIAQAGVTVESMTVAVVLAFLVIVAGTAVIRVRIKSTTHGI